jgi:hypothetical protein
MPAEQKPPPLVQRLLWFAGLWLAGVGRGWLRNRILRRISALHHARQPHRRPLANKTG